MTAYLGPVWRRLTEEHRSLGDMVFTLEAKVRAAGVDRGGRRSYPEWVLDDLHRSAAALRSELELHSLWETEDLFPMLMELFGTPEGHIIVTSLWMLEKEHELADEFFDSFFREVGDLKAGRRDAALIRVLEDLMQAIRLVREHLEAEEELLLPLMQGSLQLAGERE
ncbi:MULTISPECIES: hemerythrin domain-containing protein [Paenibacillus]|uniref:hemerythrin domain-containing protein n=1 Tax=Paenibacillus TaxID=44249 RepID=UPI0022B8FC31|nr:hemerythrin domain-containing protein [Paenibacillus caseinilyticus]MCZ8518194.1 hemerythrin domain-containing protein [Paenibacillus caseinilyticus]